MSSLQLTDDIQPVENLSLVEKVEFRLMELMATRQLAPGDMLPKEVELAEAFEVSRTVIREALTRLKVRGVVESVKRKGTQVTHPDILSNLRRVLQPPILDEQTLRDIFEIRLVLEVGMADLLFARMEAKDLEELRAIAGREPEGGGRTIFDADFEIEFHGTLYEISGNRTLTEFQKLLLPIFDYVHRDGQLGAIEDNGTYVSHRRLVEVLENGTPGDFRQAMRAHLDNQFQRVFPLRA